jgi:hypothetical protein
MNIILLQRGAREREKERQREREVITKDEARTEIEG